MKTIANLGLAFLLALATAACTTVADDGGQNGPDAGNGVDGANDDEVPGPETAAYTCRGGKDTTGDYFECNPSAMDHDAALTPTWVGACPSESVNGYWSGPKKVAVLNANGWWRLYLQGTPTDCEITVSQCSDRNNPHCWLQYGKNVPGDPNANNPYRWCGADGNCAMKFKRNVGHKPTPLGN